MKNYKRREVIKAGAKLGASIGFWGTVGHYVGKAYQGTVGYVGNKLADYDRRIEESKHPVAVPVREIKKAEDWRSNFWNKTLGRNKGNQAELREAYGVGDSRENREIIKKEPPIEDTRRGFLSRLMGYGARHPVEAGTTVGAIYGLKNTPGTVLTARSNIKTAQLEERVRELENSSSKKDKPAEHTNEENRYNFLLFLGLSFLFASIFFTNFNLTGNAILEMPKIVSEQFFLFTLLGFFLITLFVIIKTYKSKYGLNKIMGSLSLKTALTCKTTDSIVQVAKKLAKEKQRHIFVLDNSDLAGIISTTDISNKVVAENLDLSKTLARDIMVKEVISFEKTEDPCKIYMELIKRSLVSCPITIRKKFVGILELRDLMNSLASCKIDNGKKN